MQEMRSTLVDAGVSKRVSYELGNEPNAASYFWGDAAQFGPIADAAHEVVSDGDVTCCAFTSSLGGYNKENGTVNGFVDFAKGAATRYPSTPLSLHYYRHSTNDANNNVSTYANLTAFYGPEALRGAVLTEWGVYTYQSRRASQEMASPRLMNEFVHLLDFAYEYKIAEVDAHCLADHPHKGGHNCYFDRFMEPRASYDMHKARVVFDVASRGDAAAATWTVSRDTGAPHGGAATHPPRTIHVALRGGAATRPPQVHARAPPHQGTRGGGERHQRERVRIQGREGRRPDHRDRQELWARHRLRVRRHGRQQRDGRGLRAPRRLGRRGIFRV